MCICLRPPTYSVDVNLHSELQSANLTSQYTGSTPLLLRDCSILAAMWHHLLLLLQQLDHTSLVRGCACSVRQMRQGLWWRGSKMRWRSWSLCVPGLLWWWTTLWTAVTAVQGGLPQGWQYKCTSSPSYCDECKIDKGSLICADRGKNPLTTSAVLLLLVLGEINLITGSVKRCDHSPSSNLHINVAWRVQPAMFMDGWGWGDCF